MSSRKRNKRTAKADDRPASEIPAVASAAAEEGASPSEPPAPVVSEIIELRPRDDVDAEPEADGGDDEEEQSEQADVFSPAAPKTRAHTKRVLESLIFVSDQIITAQQLARIVRTKQAEVRELLAEISVEYEGRGIELVEVAGGYQFRSVAASAQYVQSLVAQRPVRLTRAQLETLALIAYRQPITRPEIDDVRGVDSGSALKVLCERELVKILGRKEEAGRPLLYGTTPFFLEFFGMNAMTDLPTLREFTELSDEHRELFQRKTGEIPDLSNEPAPEVVSSADDAEHEGELEDLDGAEPISAEQESAEVSSAEVDHAPDTTTPHTDSDAEDSAEPA